MGEMRDVHPCDYDFGVDVGSLAAVLVNEEAIDNSLASIGGMISGGTEVFDAFHEIIAELLVLVRKGCEMSSVPLPKPEGGNRDHIFRQTWGIRLPRRRHVSLREVLALLYPCLKAWKE
jgi:hypothetical protein